VIKLLLEVNVVGQCSGYISVNFSKDFRLPWTIKQIFHVLWELNLLLGAVSVDIRKHHPSISSKTIRNALASPALELFVNLQRVWVEHFLPLCNTCVLSFLVKCFNIFLSLWLERYAYLVCLFFLVQINTILTSQGINPYRFFNDFFIFYFLPASTVKTPFFVYFMSKSFFKLCLRTCRLIELSSDNAKLVSYCHISIKNR